MLVRNPVSALDTAMFSSARDYLRCIMAGTSMAGMGRGFPDGNVMPSITMEVRQTLTITPDAGVVRVVVAPTAFGCLAILKGELSVPQTTYSFNASTASGVTTLTSSLGLGIVRMNQLPIDDGFVRRGLNQGVSSYPEFRVLAVSVDSIYTGSTMNNAGVVVFTRGGTPVTPVDTYPMGYNITDIQNIGSYARVNAVASDLNPTSVIWPARRSAHFVLASPRPEYIPVKPMSIPQSAVGFGYYTGTLVGELPAPTYYPSQSMLIDYGGMNTGATITINARMCVQFTVFPNSPLAPLSSVSPTADPYSLAKIAKYISELPVVKDLANNALGKMGQSLNSQAAR